MASSNRHWPSMFKSKHNHQWHHELNSPLASSAACHRTAYTPGLGCEERAPEPKPRWNPRPEQIRILEAIFNSGMVNPPRDEIRRIRAQLQEYGQVGDANVFYWFQNRKSRTKHKQRQAAASNTTTTPHLHPPTAPVPQPPTTKTTTTTPNSYSSSSSDKSSTSKTISTSAATAAHVIDLMNSPTASVNNQHLHHQQPFVQASSEFLSEPFFFPAQSLPPPVDLGQGFCLSGGEAADQGVGGCQNFLLSELMLMSNCPSKIRNGDRDDHQKMKLHDQQHLTYAAATAVSDPTHHFLHPDNQILQGLHDPVGPTRSSTVFINDVCFEVGAGPFSVREAFGDDAVLIQSSGHPVLTNEWGITVQPLQHGGFYYLLRPSAALSPDNRTVDLI